MKEKGFTEQMEAIFSKLVPSVSLLSIRKLVGASFNVMFQHFSSNSIYKYFKYKKKFQHSFILDVHGRSKRLYSCIDVYNM
jgi:hypothetical protein